MICCVAIAKTPAVLASALPEDLAHGRWHLGCHATSEALLHPGRPQRRGYQSRCLRLQARKPSFFGGDRVTWPICNHCCIVDAYLNKRKPKPIQALRRHLRFLLRAQGQQSRVQVASSDRALKQMLHKWSSHLLPRNRHTSTKPSNSW